MNRHQKIPGDSCFWAWLDPAALGEAGGTAEPAALKRALERGQRDGTLDEAFARWISMPIDSVHAVYTVVQPAGQQAAVLGCAAPKAILDHFVEQGMLVVTPDGSPPPPSIVQRLDGAAVPLLNLFTGEYEPRVLRRLRLASAAAAAAALIAVTAITWTGLSRRAELLEATAQALSTKAERIYARAVPALDRAPTPPSSPSAPAANGSIRRLPAETTVPINPANSAATRAALELRRLKTSSTEATTRRPAVDAAVLLAEVLAHWPQGASKSGLFVTTQSLQVGATAVTITASVPAEADADLLADALRDIPGWTLQQTQRSAAGSGGAGATEPKARIVLRLVPDRGERKTTLMIEQPEVAP